MASVLKEKENFSYFQCLKKRLALGEATIAIAGMGYVGFPLTLALNRKGFSVIGFDVDRVKIQMIQERKSYIKGIGDHMIQDLLDSGRFRGTSDSAELKNADAVLICVPTPLTKNREPDMSYVVATITTIAQYLRPGQLIILESTTYPGTTTELIQPVLEETGLVVGKDIFLAYSPEREDPGNPHYETAKIPKVLGANDPFSSELAETLYAQIVPQVICVSSSAAAEAVKLTENIFRCVNIALVNELKIVYAQMGIDIWEVIEAAKTKPFGFMPFYPGPGLGGHCIPIDPFYLTWKAREFGLSTRFVELSGEINTSMPSYVLERLREELDGRFCQGLNGTKILIMGVAYKKNVDDMRESPALILYELLQKKGALTDYHDPFISVIPNTKEHPNLKGIASVPFTQEQLRLYDAVVICTDHDAVDYDFLVQHSRLVIDTRNATANLKGKNNVAKA